MKAHDLAFVHVGAEISWRIEDPEVLLEAWTPPRECAWIAFDGDNVVIGLWPAEEDSDVFEEFYLSPLTEIALTVEGEPWQVPS